MRLEQRRPRRDRRLPWLLLNQTLPSGEALFKQGDGRHARKAFVGSENTVNQGSRLRDEQQFAITGNNPVEVEVCRWEADNVSRVGGSPERGRFEVVFDGFEAFVPAAFGVGRGMLNERSMNLPQ